MHTKKRGRRISRKGKRNSSMFSFFRFKDDEPKFKDNFEKEKPPIGKGSFGRVWKAHRKRDGEIDYSLTYAVKQLNKDMMQQSDFIQVEDEVHALSSLKHQNIVRFHGKYESKEYFYIIMECVSGCNLRVYIRENKNMSEPQAIKCVYQILSALAYCEKVGVIHRDIKPSNVMLSGDIDNNPMVKLIDFGFSTTIDLKVHSSKERFLDAWVGTIVYASPEILLKKKYNFKTDIWSVGVLTYEILSGIKPFILDLTKRRGKEKMISKVVSGKYNFKDPVWNDISMDSKDFIFRLLQVKVIKRFSAVQAMYHKWLKSENIEEAAKLSKQPKATRTSVFEMKSDENSKADALRQKALFKFEKVGDMSAALMDLRQEMELGAQEEEEAKKKQELKGNAMAKLKNAFNLDAAARTFAKDMGLPEED